MEQVWPKKTKKNNSKIAWSVYVNQWNENYLKCMFGFSVLHDAASHKNENASVEMGYQQSDTIHLFHKWKGPVSE